MISVVIEEYEIRIDENRLPAILDSYLEKALLSEHFEESSDHDEDAFGPLPYFFVGVSKSVDWPFLVVTQQYSPSGPGFTPGVLVAPEVGTLFIGAGDRLLCYDLNKPERLWMDSTQGFWGWARSGSTVLMLAELDFSGWDITGHKLWSIYVEPPWGFEINGDTLKVDVMGEVTHYHLRTGERIISQ